MVTAVKFRVEAGTKRLLLRCRVGGRAQPDKPRNCVDWDAIRGVPAQTRPGDIPRVTGRKGVASGCLRTGSQHQPLPRRLGGVGGSVGPGVGARAERPLETRHQPGPVVRAGQGLPSEELVDHGAVAPDVHCCAVWALREASAAIEVKRSRAGREELWGAVPRRDHLRRHCEILLQAWLR